MDKFKSYFHTVDGRNPASVEVCSLSHSLQGFIHPKWLAGFQNVGWIPASMIKQHKYNTSYILTYFHLPRLHQQRESIWIWMIMNEWLQAIRLLFWLGFNACLQHVSLQSLLWVPRLSCSQQRCPACEEPYWHKITSAPHWGETPGVQWSVVNLQQCVVLLYHNVG